MTEPLYVGGAAGYDEMFAPRGTQAFIPTLLHAAQISEGQHILDVATGTLNSADFSMKSASQERTDNRH